MVVFQAWTCSRIVEPHDSATHNLHGNTVSILGGNMRIPLIVVGVFVVTLVLRVGLLMYLEPGSKAVSVRMIPILLFDSIGFWATVVVAIAGLIYATR
jgi:hypothetical protein